MANRYWVGGSGTWDTGSTANWSASSGGSGGASSPTNSDSVFFDQAGTYTVTISAARCLDWNVTAGTVTFSGSGSFIILGSINLISGTVCSLSSSFPFGISLQGSTKTIQTNGTAFPNTGISIDNGGDYELSDNLNTSFLSVTNGTFRLNGKTVTTGRFELLSGVSLYFSGSGGTVSINNGGLFNVTGTPTLGGTGTISMSGTSTFNGNGSNFTGVTLSKAGTGTVYISGSNTFSTITRTSTPATFYFEAGTTTTITTLSVSGSAGNLVNLRSSVSGSQFTLSKANGTVSLDYLSISDSNATGGALWYAGGNSTNAGNNSGWVFSPPVPASSSTGFFLIF